MQVTTIGLDIAKNVFQVHVVDQHRLGVLRKRLARGKVRAFFANLPRCVVGLEAFGGAHYWTRELTKVGHEDIKDSGTRYSSEPAASGSSTKKS